MPEAAVYQAIRRRGGRLGLFGINWEWAHFPTKEAAQSFVKYLEAHGWDHRGVYPPNHLNPDWAVRFC